MSNPDISLVHPAFFFNVNKPYIAHFSPAYRQLPEPLPKMFAFPLGFNFNPQQQTYGFTNFVETFNQLLEPLLSEFIEEPSTNAKQPELPKPVLQNLENLRNVLVNLHAQLGVGFQPQEALPLPRELLKVLLRVPVFIRQIEHILKNAPPEVIQPKETLPTKKNVEAPSIPKQEKPTTEKQEALPKTPVPVKVFEEFKRTFPVFVKELESVLPKLPVTTPPIVKETVQVYLKTPIVQVFAPNTPIIQPKPEKPPIPQPAAPIPSSPVTSSPITPQAKPLPSKVFIPEIQRQAEKTVREQEAPKQQQPLQAAPLLERPAAQKKTPRQQAIPEKLTESPVEKVQIAPLPLPTEKLKKPLEVKAQTPSEEPMFVKPQKVPLQQVFTPRVQEKPLEAPETTVTPPPIKKPIVEQPTILPPTPKTPTPLASLPKVPEPPLPILEQKPTTPPPKEVPPEKAPTPILVTKQPIPPVPIPPPLLPEAQKAPVEGLPIPPTPITKTTPPPITQPPKVMILNYPGIPPRPQNLTLPPLNIPRGFPTSIPLIIGPNVMARVEAARIEPPFSTEIPFAFIVPYASTFPIAASSSKPPLAKAKIVKEDEDEEGTEDEKLQVLIYIPGGETWYGDPLKEGAPDEQPLRVLTVKTFGIGIYPVINEQFADFLTEEAKREKIYLGEKGNVFSNEGVLLCRIKDGITASDIETDPHKRFLGFKPTPGKESYPVTCVTYFGAEAFCKASDCRLPTEIEWERAASIKLDNTGKVEKKFRFGCGQDVINPSLATYQNKSAAIRTLDSRTTPVGLYNGKTTHTKDGRSFQSANAASFFGCYDMSGNVWEWTSTGEEGHKIIKGGCFESPPTELRASARKLKETNSLDGLTGFRVAMN